MKRSRDFVRTARCRFDLTDRSRRQERSHRSRSSRSRLSSLSALKIALNQLHDELIVAGVTPAIAVDAADQHLTIVIDFH